jgi:uncharacterized protein (TIRG00374 family)
MTASPKDANRKRLFRALRVVVTVALLYWVFRQASIRQIIDTLGDANLRLLGLTLVLFQGGIVLRATRWWVLLRGSGVDASPRQVLELQYISQFFNVSLPTGFAGDVVRTFEFQGGDSKAGTAGIVVLDRTLGFATLFGIALVSLALGHRLLDPNTALVLTAISLGGLVAVVVVLQGDLVRRLTRFLPKSLSLEGDGLLARLYGALTGCSPSYLVLAIVVSALSTTLTIVVHYLIGRSVGIEVGVGVFFIVTPVVTISLLVPTIGGLGLVAGYPILLAPLGVPGSVAVALGFGVYVARLSAGLLGGLYNLLWASRR